MSKTAHLVLSPRDGLFCKDGRGWHTSASGRGASLDWPWPSTVLGALRTACGRAEETAGRSPDWAKRKDDVCLGSLLTLRRPKDRANWNAQDRVWPVPVDALRIEEKDTAHFLDPLKPQLTTLGRDDNAAREALWVPRVDDRAKPLPLPRWWSEDSFVKWLCRDKVLADPKLGGHETTRRVQSHVGIKPDTFTADDGALFAHDVIETLERDHEWGIGLTAQMPSATNLRMATLGSDGRLARIETLDSGSLFAMPDVLRRKFKLGSAGLRVVVVTPALFADGWLPDGFQPDANNRYVGKLHPLAGEFFLRAAFVPRPLNVSGWDMASRGPKKTDRMVPPGSVYFFEHTDKEPITEAEAEALWLGVIGARTEEGFGRVVPGIWTPIQEGKMQ